MIEVLSAIENEKFITVLLKIETSFQFDAQMRKRCMNAVPSGIFVSRIGGDCPVILIRDTDYEIFCVFQHLFYEYSCWIGCVLM